MMNISQLRVVRANGQIIRYEDLRRAKEEEKIACESGKDTGLLNKPHLKKNLNRKMQSSLQTMRRNLPVP